MKSPARSGHFQTLVPEDGVALASRH